jgi:excisionase family DNA binding protein
MTVKFSIPPFENVYTTKETAVRLKVSESFLAKKRVSGGGPKFTKIGRTVRYPEVAINEYLAAQLRSSTSDPGLVSGTRSDETQNAGSTSGVHPS